MDAHLRQRDQSSFALHERLAIAALVAGVSLWLRVGEVVPERRHER